MAGWSSASQHAHGSSTERLKSDLVGLIFHKKNDIFKKMPLRLLGYGYAVEEALSYNNRQQSKTVFSLVSGGFILFHCFNQMLEIAAEEDDSWVLIKSERNIPADMVLAFCDTFVWEALASVALPTIAAFTFVRVTDAVLAILCSECRSIRRWLPVFVGIAVLPLLAFTIDSFVENFMDDTIRTLYPPRHTRLVF